MNESLSGHTGGVVEEGLKGQVRDYWNRQACGTEFSRGEKYSRRYFDRIEQHRYAVVPEIFSFAQFTRAHDKKVLEVGVGAGTDFLQWVRAGARATGVDLTTEAIAHVERRLELYGLQAEEVRVADCEKLPFEDGRFDLVYSCGVIHHTPDTRRALDEIVRVCRPGGQVKVMVYHRHSMVSYVLWIKQALLKLRPWKSLSWCLYHHMESEGTKAYTAGEIAAWLEDHEVDDVKIYPYLTYYDLLGASRSFFRSAARVVSNLLGHHRVGWFLFVEFTKR